MRKKKMLLLISHIVVEFVNLMTPSILYIVNVNNVNEYIWFDKHFQIVLTFLRLHFILFFALTNNEVS